MPLDGSAEEIAQCRQQYPLPPDVRYALDNMLSDWEIDEGSYIALNLFVPRAPILEAIDGNTRYRALGTRLMGLVDEALPVLPQEVRNGIAQTSLQWLRRDLIGLAEVYAGWAIEDEVTGGAMKPWLPRWRRRIRRNGEMGKRTARRLHSPAFIARTVRANVESRHRRDMAKPILDRVEAATALTDCLGDYARDMEEQRERAREAGIRRLVGAERISGARPGLLRKQRRRSRAVIRRSLRAAAAVLPDSKVRLFARGESVRLPGDTLDLAVRLQGTLDARGHGALAVTALVPGGAAALASLCVYHEGLPALDQLAALALAMSAGEEADIIHDANITTMLPGGREHPLLAEREKRDLAARTVEARVWTRIDRSYWSNQDLQARRNAYWQATRRIWTERLAVFVGGRRFRMLDLTQAMA
jgi:hypothetical protein